SSGHGFGKRTPAGHGKSSYRGRRRFRLLRHGCRDCGTSHSSRRRPCNRHGSTQRRGAVAPAAACPRSSRPPKVRVLSSPPSSGLLLRKELRVLAVSLALQLVAVDEAK